MRTHLHINIAKAVNWPDSDLVIFSDPETGTQLPSGEVRDILKSYLAEGKELFPCGDCDNFDYKTGCRGHPQENS